MRSMTWLLVAAALFGAPGLVFAGGGSKGDWEIGVYGGYAWLDDYDFLKPEDSFLGGARLGYFLTPAWGLEASVQRVFSETEMDMLGVEDVDMNIDSGRLNLLYNFAPGSKIRPFLTGGVGMETVDTDGLGESSDFGWNAGGGLRFFLSPSVNLRADGRFVSASVGDVIDETAGNLEATLGLGFLFGGDDGEEEEEIGVIETPNQAPTVSLTSDRSQLTPGERANLTATATDPEGDPITYDWSSSTGSVAGTGSTATYEMTGTSPGSATITVRATDSHGNSGTDDVTISLGAPAAPQAEAVSCIAGGFPRNLSRLNNVDKACLDDVAARLSADPRAKVIVIGHADADESNPEGTGKARADAVEDYLEGRGVEASRITTRSAGATKAGAGSNRRVEVWFVPEGATEPR